MSVSAGAVLAEVEKATIDSVRALWEAQHKALDAHDIDGVLATYADSEDIMLMGTGPGEHWVGKAEVKDAYSNFTNGFDAHTMDVKCGEGAGSRRGDVTWVTGVCSFSDMKADQSREFVTNVSAVLVKQGDDWRFHTMHFSHLTGGDQAGSQASTK
jgi:ketosteroid isomerase-like protein